MSKLLIPTGSTTITSRDSVEFPRRSTLGYVRPRAQQMEAEAYAAAKPKISAAPRLKSNSPDGGPTG